MTRHEFLFVIALFSIAATFTTVAITAPAQPQTRIETEQASGAVRFIIEGREDAASTRPVRISGMPSSTAARSAMPAQPAR